MRSTGIKSLDELLSDSPGDTLQRESTEFERRIYPFKDIVLFGAGNLGRMIHSKLGQIGITPLAFADNNPMLWGSTAEGTPVLSPVDAAARFGSSAAFMIAIWGVGSKDRMAARVRQLRDLGCRNVLPFLTLFWKYPDLFLPYHVIDRPSRVAEDAALVRAACELWNDDFSRQEYIAQVKWRLWGEFDCMADPIRETMYFPQDLFALSRQEVFVDCGAFNGDTIASFLHATCSGFKQVFAFESDPANFAELRNFVAALEPAARARIVAHRNAVGAAAAKMRFRALGSDGSAVDVNGETEVDCVSLDQALPADASPTHIKMDIEGAEAEGLLGARTVIKRHMPILAICSYHKQSDLWRIPLLIHSICPEYRMYLRPHLNEGWDTVCYAVPAGR